MRKKVRKQILAKKGNKRVDATSYVAASLAFNESVKRSTTWTCGGRWPR